MERAVGERERAWTQQQCSLKSEKKKRNRNRRKRKSFIIPTGME